MDFWIFGFLNSSSKLPVHQQLLCPWAPAKHDNPACLGHLVPDSLLQLPEQRFSVPVNEQEVTVVQGVSRDDPPPYDSNVSIIIGRIQNCETNDFTV